MRRRQMENRCSPKVALARHGAALVRDKITYHGQVEHTVLAFGDEIRVSSGPQWSLPLPDRFPIGATRARSPSLTPNLWFARDKSTGGLRYFARGRIYRNHPMNELFYLQSLTCRPLGFGESCPTSHLSSIPSSGMGLLLSSADSAKDRGVANVRCLVVFPQPLGHFMT